MDKFKERFLQSVDSHAIVLRLEIEKVIPGRLSHSIRNQCASDGNQQLFLYLQRQADPESICKLCNEMVRDKSYKNMNSLGRDMRRELDLLTGIHVHTYCYVALYVVQITSMCTYERMHVLCVLCLIFTCISTATVIMCVCMYFI